MSFYTKCRDDLKFLSNEVIIFYVPHMYFGCLVDGQCSGYCVVYLENSPSKSYLKSAGAFYLVTLVGLGYLRHGRIICFGAKGGYFMSPVIAHMLF